MKKFLSYITICMLILCMFGMTVGCQSPVEKDTFYNVTFNFNYEGAAQPKVESVQENSSVAEPTSPSREGYIFEGWFTDSECQQEFLFVTAITKNIILYAKWANADSKVVVTYNYNYPNSPAAFNVTIDKNSAASEPKVTDKGPNTAVNSWEEYGIIGWYTDSACLSKFDFSQTLISNITLYANWGTLFYVFEAEYTDLDGIMGIGSSTEYHGTEMIYNATYDPGFKASNNNFVRGLYDDGLAITFDIFAEKAASNVKLVARYSFENREYITMTSDEFQILVNGNKLVQPTISLTGLKSNELNEFKDYVISTTVSLNAGKNTITLLTKNEDDGGVGYAKAPMIDCLKFFTSETLRWTPKLSNVSMED